MEAASLLRTRQILHGKEKVWSSILQGGSRPEARFEIIRTGLTGSRTGSGAVAGCCASSATWHSGSSSPGTPWPAGTSTRGRGASLFAIRSRITKGPAVVISRAFICAWAKTPCPRVRALSSSSRLTLLTAPSREMNRFRLTGATPATALAGDPLSGVSCAERGLLLEHVLVLH